MNFTVPPNAIVVHTTLTIQTGILSRTLDTSIMIQTANWAEVVRAIEDCWRVTMEKANATAPVPPGK